MEVNWLKGFAIKARGVTDFLETNCTKKGVEEGVRQTGEEKEFDIRSSNSWWCLISDNKPEQAKAYFTPALYILLVTFESPITFKHQASNSWSIRNSNLSSDHGSSPFFVLILMVE